MLSIILIESYLLFVQQNKPVSGVENQLDSTSQTPTSSLPNESSTESPTSPEAPSTEPSNETTNDMVSEPSLSIPKPSVPEFTLKYADNSYDVPPTYGIDQYTGKNVTTSNGYRVDNRSIEFTIKNQHFTPYNDSDGRYIGLYYNFRLKGPYGAEWDYCPIAPNGRSTRRYGGMFGSADQLPEIHLCASNSEYTVIAMSLSELSIQDITDEGQVEIQVQALIGHLEPDDFMLAGHTYIFTGESSDWSATQTLTIGENTATATPAPSVSPSPSVFPSASPSATPQDTDSPQGIDGSETLTVPGLDWAQLATLALLGAIVILLVVAVVYLRRRSKL